MDHERLMRGMDNVWIMGAPYVKRVSRNRRMMSDDGEPVLVQPPNDTSKTFSGYVVSQ